MLPHSAPVPNPVILLGLCIDESQNYSIAHHQILDNPNFNVMIAEGPLDQILSRTAEGRSPSPASGGDLFQP